MKHLDFLLEELEQLEKAGLRRQRVTAPRNAEDVVVACSNDYLGYGALPVSRETLSSMAEPLGAGASRLVFGTTPAHLALEQRLAAWLQSEAALLFSSGYLANFSTISALVGPQDSIFSDRLNHASIIDGCRQSQAKLHIYDHLSLDHLEKQLNEAGSHTGRKLIATESYFSMDGDSPDFPRLAALCRDHAAMLFVDEAHALGVFGEKGEGLARKVGVQPDITVGTLGKAVGSSGAFIAGSAALCDWVWNRARGFVFSTAPSPLLCRLTVERVERVITDEAARNKLGQLSRRFEDRLSSVGFKLSRGRHGPIFPLTLGAPTKALRVAELVREQGFLVQAIRPPTVPEGTSRLRIVLNATFDEATVDRLAEVLAATCPPT